MKKKFFLFSVSGISVIILVIASTFLVIHMETNGYIYKNIDTIPHADTALLPGASVTEEGTLSPVLKDRADATIALYRNGKVDTILVSGDNSTSTYNEVSPVKAYLVLHGVEEKDIILDYAGFDTYSSMYRARDIFLVDTITIVSQDFHLPRALYIAHHLGITANGYVADNGHYLRKNYTREWFANIKAVIDLVFEVRPKYLGEVLPIEDEQ